MPWIVVEGLKPYDGRYPFDLEDEFTNREWRWLKQLAGYMPLTFEQGFRGGDPDLFTCFALIALHRAGRVSADEVTALFDRFSDLTPFSMVRLEGDPEDADTSLADVGPPDGSSSSNGSSSGPASSERSEGSTDPSSGSGIPRSATSPSDRPMLPISHLPN